MVEEHSKNIDPDPWVVATLVVTTIGVLAQLSSLALQISDRKPQRWESLAGLQTRHLQEAVDEALRIAERISAFLARKGASSETLDKSFRSGEVSLFLSQNDFLEYQQFVERLTFNLSAVSHATLALIDRNDEFARKIGSEVMKEIGSLSDRVNKMNSAPQTFGYVFEESLFVLRALSKILGRLRGLEN